MVPSSAAFLKVTLDDVEPRVMRRVIVPATIRLDRLHLVIQAAMGWGNCHLFEIKIGDAGWGEPAPDGHYQRVLDASKALLIDALEDAGRKAFRYIYDFGDHWSHTVTLESVVLAVPGAPDIELIEAEGRCPPEDCGGAPGYAYLLEILADPKHDDHSETLSWCGGPIDPTNADRDAREAAVDRLAKRWASSLTATPTA